MPESPAGTGDSAPVPVGFRLPGTETTPSSVAAQVYESAGAPDFGAYEAGAHS